MESGLHDIPWTNCTERSEVHPTVKMGMIHQIDMMVNVSYRVLNLTSALGVSNMNTKTDPPIPKSDAYLKVVKFT